jgi:hypothetical protein
MGGIAQSRRTMDVESDIPPSGRRFGPAHEGRVHANADTHLNAAGPGLRAKGRLAVERRRNGVERAARECDKERVALRIQHASVPLPEDLSQYCRQVCMNPTVCIVTQHAQQARRALDIREQQGDPLWLVHAHDMIPPGLQTRPKMA